MNGGRLVAFVNVHSGRRGLYWLTTLLALRWLA